MSTVPRIFVDEAMHAGQELELPAAQAHHVGAVLRRGTGDPLVVFNGQGGEFAATLQSVARRTVRVRLDEHRAIERESPLQVTLAQGISKGERMDYTIQKAVELGVAEIAPLVTDHCVVRLSDERWQRKQEHWQSIAVAAAEQSGRTRVPSVAPVTDLRDWLNAAPVDTLRLVLAPEADAPAGTLRQGGQRVALVVGPEGGFSDLELRLADLAGCVALSLGPRILRTETAGVVAMSLVQALWGDLKPKEK
ncbi:MAG TPA: 16S rRNA (uracil(1498)-N(3))-methyltransferase [Candidatus Binatia bacterium]|nr:16S rRNA (uracil(1498)-N(3))-methyltransferase [Candidatus Binatia bacterium]